MAYCLGSDDGIWCQGLRRFVRISRRGRAWSAQKRGGDVGTGREARLFLALRSSLILRPVAFCRRDSKVAPLGTSLGADLRIEHIPAPGVDRRPASCRNGGGPGTARVVGLRSRPSPAVRSRCPSCWPAGGCPSGLRCDYLQCNVSTVRTLPAHSHHPSTGFPHCGSPGEARRLTCAYSSRDPVVLAPSPFHLTLGTPASQCARLRSR